MNFYEGVRSGELVFVVHRFREAARASMDSVRECMRSAAGAKALYLTELCARPLRRCPGGHAPSVLSG